MLIDPPRLPDCRDGITPRHFASGTGLVQTPIERHSSAPFIGFPWSLRARSFHWPAALKCDALKEDRLFSPVLAQNRFFPPSLFLKFSTRFSFGLFFFIYERSNVFCGVKSIDRFYDSFIFGEAVLFVSFSFFSFSSPLSRLSGCTRCLCKVFVNGEEQEKCVDYWYFSIARCVLKRRLENFSRTFARV